MPATVTQNLISNDYILIFAKGAILLILIFYAIFSLIIVRQVDLMSKTFITRISPLVKGIAIVHAGLAIGLIVLAWGML